MKVNAEIAIGLLCVASGMQAHAASEIMCSYAPSQSSVVSAISGAGGGSAATLAAVAKATGLSVVAHSSGGAILTGSGGYIAGTLGSAAAAPFIVTAGLIVGTTAVTVELLCARRNHPDQVAKIEAAATEFHRRLEAALPKVKPKAGAILSVGKAKVARIKENVLDYAYSRIPKDRVIVLEP